MKVGELVVGVYETVPRKGEQNSADGHELLTGQFLRSPVNLLRGQLVETALEKHMVEFRPLNFSDLTSERLH